MARTIVVTGAASGIGKETARQLEAAGDTVLRVDLREGDVTGDLGDPDGVDRVAAEITERIGGRLDGLVANAGVSAPSELSVKINFPGTVQLIEGLRPLLAAGTDPRSASPAPPRGRHLAVCVRERGGMAGPALRDRPLDALREHSIDIRVAQRRRLPCPLRPSPPRRARSRSR